MSDLLNPLMGVAQTTAVQHGTLLDLLRDLLPGRSKPYPIPKGLGRVHEMSDRAPKVRRQKPLVLAQKYVAYIAAKCDAQRKKPKPVEPVAYGPVTNHHDRVLALLRAEKRPMRPIEIAKATGCSRHHITRYLAKEIEDGVVTVRRPNQNASYYEFIKND